MQNGTVGQNGTFAHFRFPTGQRILYRPKLVQVVRLTLVLTIDIKTLTQVNFVIGFRDGY